jgi:hypothetical protein
MSIGVECKSGISSHNSNPQVMFHLFPHKLYYIHSNYTTYSPFLCLSIHMCV